MLQGLRLHQEDRILCMSDIVLPPFGEPNLLFKAELEVSMIIEGFNEHRRIMRWDENTER
jgi:hypothetical protein